MPSTEPPNATWYSRLSRQTQALLLALLMFAVSIVTFLFGIQDYRTGGSVALVSARTDWTEDALLSAGAFALGAALLAVSMGWKPGGTKTEPPKQ